MLRLTKSKDHRHYLPLSSLESPDLKRDNKNPWLTWDKSKKKIKKASDGERGVPVAGKAITPGIQWLCKQLIAGLDETSRLKNRIDCEKERG